MIKRSMEAITVAALQEGCVGCALEDFGREITRYWQ
jgi:hypothetical protein